VFFIMFVLFVIVQVLLHVIYWKQDYACQHDILCWNVVERSFIIVERKTFSQLNSKYIRHFPFFIFTNLVKCVILWCGYLSCVCVCVRA
jgi:hypothetical protein